VRPPYVRSTIGAMEELAWNVATHGDRVVLNLPLVEDGNDVGYAFDMAPESAREMADALRDAAEAAES